MFLWLLAWILLARPCLADDDPLLELTVGARSWNREGHDLQNSAFITDENRKKINVIRKNINDN